MFLVVKKEGNLYHILDSEDMSVDIFSKEELAPLLQAGLEIFGVSDFTLKYDLKMTVILRLYGKTKSDVKDYDGYLLRDFCSEYAEYTTQIIDIVEHEEEFKNIEFFYTVLDTLRSLNKGLYNLSYLDNSNTGYTVYAGSNEVLTLKELETGNVYSCDFFTCLYIYLEEHKSIKPLDFISLDSLIYGSNTLSARTELEKYYSSSFIRTKKDVLVTSNNSCSEGYVEANWGTLDSVFGNMKIIYTGNMCFPAYNIKSVIRKRDEVALIPFFTRNDEVYEFENGRLHFKNGNTLEGANQIAKRYKALNYTDDRIIDEVKHWLDIRKTKNKMLNRGSDIEKYESLSSLIDYGSVPIPEFEAGYFLEEFYFSTKTPYGTIEVLKENYVEDLKFSAESLWMLRMTRVGSCVYNFKQHSVVAGAMKSISFGGCICNEMYQLCLEEAGVKGISYYKDYITPLCVGEIKIDSNGVSILVDCMIRPIDDDLTGINVIRVPLIFLGGNFTEYYDCYAYKCLFQTIYFEKSLIDSLYGTFDADTRNIWGTTNKKSEELRMYLDKDNKRLFSKDLSR